jgi:hypothetical protein
MFLPRTGTWQGAVALTCAVLAVQLTLHIPAQLAAAHRYHQTAPCTDNSSTPCLNRDLESIQSTDIRSGWLETPSLVLAATGGNDAHEMEFSSPTTWLSSLRPGEQVYVEWLSDGPVTSIGPSDGGPMLRTSDSPDYDADTNITAATCFAALAALFGTWSAALIRQRFRRVRPPFRRWVPAASPAALLLCALGLRSALLPGPLSVSFFALPAALLAGGLFWARTTARSRYRRAAD